MRDYAILLSDLLLDEGFLTGAGPSLSAGDEQFPVVAGAERPGGFCRPADGRENPPDRGCRGFRSQAVLDCRDIEGTNCYCSDDALEELRRRLAKVPLDTIHWIDTGDYHYLTALFLERIGEPFDLVLFDNHPDDQAPAFGDSGLLSCGSWVAWCRESLPEFRTIKGMYPTTPEGAGAGVPAEKLRLRLIPPTALRLWAPPVVKAPGLFLLLARKRKQVPSFLARASVHVATGGHSFSSGDPDARNTPEGLPVYLSIDLDILSREEFVTDWDQGEMRFGELLKAIEDAAAGRRVLGIDVCGGLTRAKGATDAELERNLHLRRGLRSFLQQLA